MESVKQNGTHRETLSKNASPFRARIPHEQLSKKTSGEENLAEKTSKKRKLAESIELDDAASKVTKYCDSLTTSSTALEIVGDSRDQTAKSDGQDETDSDKENWSIPEMEDLEASDFDTVYVPPEQTPSELRKTDSTSCDTKPSSFAESGVYVSDDFSDFFEEWSTGLEIDLSSLQRCAVVDVTRENFLLILTVKQEDVASTARVECSGFWHQANVEEDDTVVIQARKEDQRWVVDNSAGFLIVHPDELISGTTIVGALYCKRRSVLAEKFRKIEYFPSQVANQTSMVVGSIVHELFQEALLSEEPTLANIRAAMRAILRQRSTTRDLYAAGISLSECEQQVSVYVPKIFEFIQHYTKGKRQREIGSIRGNFNGSITSVRDIEENIWEPKLGIKGRVDVTVEVNVNSKRKIVPLEVKTGRPSFSQEHRGQVFLYVMMMALTGQDTDTGLLLYLRENKFQEIKSGHPERRDLIMLRNSLAHYFVRKRASELSGSEWEPMELPEPVNNHNACVSCPYNALCSMYLSKDAAKLPESHPLFAIGKEIMEKFKPSHVDYVLKWVSLLEMEDVAQSKNNALKDLWTLRPGQREAKGSCIVQDDYVLVSTDVRTNISSGYVESVDEDSIVLLLNRDVTKLNSQPFHVDKYSSMSFASVNYANVAGLMGNDEISARLREIVIERKPATFAETLPTSIESVRRKITKDLNEDQQSAIFKAMTADDYVLIKGMPGTGKTETLVTLIRLLNETGSSVLVTANTNSAVDNILLKLKNRNVDFLRLGSTASINPLLSDEAENSVTEGCKTPESLEALLSRKNIVGVTCYGAHHALLQKRSFDVCIVDECTQALQPTVLRPLFSARKFVLVGDPDQLPPIVQSRTARKLGAEESLFARLDSSNNTVILRKQYRMNKTIMKLANDFTYCDKLEAGNSKVENATLNVSLVQNLPVEKWVEKTLSGDLSDSVILLDTGCTRDLPAEPDCAGKYPEADQMNANIWEAAVISRLLRSLAKMSVRPEDIGVMATYRAQVKLLKKIVNESVEINTVDQYQGRDKEIIFYSCAKSSLAEIGKKDGDVLEDHRRLTVAVTRAKRKLIVVADKSAMKNYTPFRKLFDLVDERAVINLNDGKDDFSWPRVMSFL